MHMTTPNGLENPPVESLWHWDRAAVQDAELGQLRCDLAAMTVLFRLLSYAVAVRSMESRLEAEESRLEAEESRLDEEESRLEGEEEEGEEGEEDAGPSLPPMGPDDWIAYC